HVADECVVLDAPGHERPSRPECRHRHGAGTRVDVSGLGGEADGAAMNVLSDVRRGSVAAGPGIVGRGDGTGEKQDVLRACSAERYLVWTAGHAGVAGRGGHALEVLPARLGDDAAQELGEFLHLAPAPGVPAVAEALLVEGGARVAVGEDLKERDGV